MDRRSRQLDVGLRRAVAQFWATRTFQAERQGQRFGAKDLGRRAAVTGGAQMDGFVDLIRALLEEVGVPKSAIVSRQTAELPGWFRSEKKWDLLVVLQRQLVAAIEFKSQVGSFGNNYNNRAEEAIGSATDLWAAYREGAFQPSTRPWLGYLMLLEEAPGSLSPVAVRQPHFAVFPEFKNASYSDRYQIMLTKLVRDRLYDSACFLLSDSTTGPQGGYREPNAELSFENFANSLIGRAMAVVVRGPRGR